MKKIKARAFCKKCKGTGFVTKRTGNAHRFGITPREGAAWTGTIDKSRNARLQVIVPVHCPTCRGTGERRTR